MTKSFKQVVFLISIIVFFTASAFTLFISSSSETGVVQAVMFWMEGCLHCHDVIENVLPPIQAKYGDKFEILLIELKSSQEVTTLYTLANNMGIPQNDVGVPFLIIGEHVLIGSSEIPEQLPGLIESYLAAGGIGFPDLPALAPLLPKQVTPTQVAPTGTQASAQAGIPAPGETVNQAPPTTMPLPTTPTPSPTTPAMVQAFQGNNGFIFAWLTIFLLFGTLGFSSIYLVQSKAWLFSAPALSNPKLIDWLVPILSLVGLGVAFYLAYVETQAVRAFCGPIGDCNTVQSSPYARLFGILPIGVLGVIGYVLILLAWAVKHFSKPPWSSWANLALLAMTFGGTLFSVYLTFLEVAVIKAICLWCISSALIMGGVLLLLSINPSPQPFPKGRGS